MESERLIHCKSELLLLANTNLRLQSNLSVTSQLHHCVKLEGRPEVIIDVVDDVGQTSVSEKQQLFG